MIERAGAGTLRITVFGADWVMPFHAQGIVDHSRGELPEISPAARSGWRAWIGIPVSPPREGDRSVRAGGVEVQSRTACERRAMDRGIGADDWKKLAVIKPAGHAGSDFFSRRLP